MTYDEDTAIVLWPEYFDKNRSRSQGRKVPKEISVVEPSLDLIAKGAMILDLEYEIYENKAYPGNCENKQGCVKVEKGKMKKTDILSKIATTLVENQ